MRPVGEGIASIPEASVGGACMEAMSELHQMGQEGVQHIIVTHVHKKGIPIMYLTSNVNIKFLEHAVSKPGHHGVELKWTSRYLQRMDVVQ